MTQLAYFARLGIITIISHSCSLIFTLIGVITWLIEKISESLKAVMQKI